MQKDLEYVMTEQDLLLSQAERQWEAAASEIEHDKEKAKEVSSHRTGRMAGSTDGECLLALVGRELLPECV